MTFQRNQRESGDFGCCADNLARSSNFTWECKTSRRPLNRTPEYSHVNVVRHVFALSFFQTTRRFAGHAENRNFCSDPRTLSFSQAESFLREHARAFARSRTLSLDIDRLRSLNSAINDCVHRPRGSRSNEYDERVAALGERAVHTDLWLIDWTPFHSTTLRHRGPTPRHPLPPRFHPMSEPTSLIISSDPLVLANVDAPHRWRIEINNCRITPTEASIFFTLSLSFFFLAKTVALNFLKIRR